MNDESKKNKEKIRRKIHLYVLSLAILFIFFIFITCKIPICFSSQCKFIGWGRLLKDNIVPFICMLLLLYCLYAYLRFKFDTKRSIELPVKIMKLEKINYEHLTFLATYIIPLITFDFEKERYVFVLAVLLVIMGVIYIKTDLFYANPSLALLGFNIYKVDIEISERKVKEGVIIISRGKLKVEQMIGYIELDDRVYYSGD
ncbi:anti-phage protein KwaA [Cronobacter dublinensis]|uniref:anti-phage protein KwaA n=1 Tax=Cronobacter dublinensis TaxID=413497 RepID=UPI00300DF51E